ncbi:ABC transporter permease [Pseudoroseomonas ludipueritiae]|uniref:ABC transporter permease n=1 Tax=Pseudoroseomonas ludipueritiae TaxID=198093 RepID=A0ABR7R4Y3_9PROT|nr:ABC transporter permease [Pseudoroseomonas ludipueritiae]MBC9176829.1 ABC transporter permease [Pseudoroseomonas ludipueritiae]MCG7360065.1 ABC transporter permease [Roseomonas sp. ACRSG]
MAEAAVPARRSGGVVAPGLPSWSGAALRVVVSIAVTLFGLMALTFFIGRMLPLDPVAAILGDNATQEAIDAMRAQLGLDQPIWVQFARYVGDVVRLDLGTALTTGKPVLTDIARVFPATIELATVGIIIGTGLGIPLGVMAAAYRDTPVDYFVRVFGLLGYSTPNFWLGLMGLVLFYATLGWVGGPGRIDTAFQWDIEPVTDLLLLDTAMAGQWEIFRDVFGHIILPASILGFGALAYISRMTRSFMLEQLSQEYVVAARVKGLSWMRTVWVHAFRNVAVQVVTVVALAYAFLLEGAVLTETVFAWPGFGRYLTNALLAGDMNAVVGCTLLIGIIFVALNLLTDLLYRLFDPRTR